MTRRAVVIGAGHYLPERVVENAEFEKTLDTSDEWIRSRSGIERRHFAAEGETTSDLATKAAQRALDQAGLAANDIDAIVLATSTADLTFPSAASMVQAKLGMDQVAAEKWIVQMVSDAQLNAKIDSESGHVILGAEPPDVYQQVIDKTKGLSFRSYVLAQNIEAKRNATPSA